MSKEVSLRKIIGAREEAYMNVRRMNMMVKNRGLYPSRYTRIDGELYPDPAGPYWGYRDILPRFKRKNVEQLLEEKITSSDGPVNLLDVGCGEGKFLQDCRKKWGDQVNLFGITASPSDFTVSPEVSIGVGDLQSLIVTLSKNGFPTDGYDMVVSSFTLRYIVDYMATIKQIHSILATGGIALIDHIKNYGQVPEEFMHRNADIDLSYEGIAFQKSSLPIMENISYVGISGKTWADRPFEFIYSKK